MGNIHGQSPIRIDQFRRRAPLLLRSRIREHVRLPCNVYEAVNSADDWCGSDSGNIESLCHLSGAVFIAFCFASSKEGLKQTNQLSSAGWSSSHIGSLRPPRAGLCCPLISYVCHKHALLSVPTAPKYYYRTWLERKAMLFAPYPWSQCVVEQGGSRKNRLQCFHNTIDNMVGNYDLMAVDLLCKAKMDEEQWQTN